MGLSRNNSDKTIRLTPSRTSYSRMFACCNITFHSLISDSGEGISATRLTMLGENIFAGPVGRDGLDFQTKGYPTVSKPNYWFLFNMFSSIFMHLKSIPIWGRGIKCQMWEFSKPALTTTMLRGAIVYQFFLSTGLRTNTINFQTTLVFSKKVGVFR